MIHVKDMVLNRQTTSRFNLAEQLILLETDIQQELTIPPLLHQV